MLTGSPALDSYLQFCKSSAWLARIVMRATAFEECLHRQPSAHATEEGDIPLHIANANDPMPLAGCRSVPTLCNVVMSIILLCCTATQQRYLCCALGTGGTGAWTGAWPMPTYTCIIFAQLQRRSPGIDLYLHCIWHICVEKIVSQQLRAALY